jgi:hypothetical protein
VSLNVTSTNGEVPGFITVYDCTTRNFVSSVNFVANTDVANAVIAPVSPDGNVCFYASQMTDLVVDINGYYVDGSSYTAVNPDRVLDTRPGQSPNAIRVVPKAKIGGEGAILEVQLTDLAGLVPASGVGAVSLNVTATGPQAAGFMNVYPCGPRALVSSLNFEAGEDVPNAVVAPLSASGTVCIYSNALTDVVVDVNGWFAG